MKNFKPKKDLTGIRNNMLVAIKCVGQAYDRHGLWLCHCDCGKEIVLKSNDFQDKRRISCGCHRKNRYGDKTSNEYIFHDTYVEGKTYNIQESFFLDYEDYEKIKEYHWKSWVKSNTSYVTGKIDGVMVLMHCFLFGEKGKDVDHKNHNGLDNRKSNIRICSHLDNCKNHKKAKNNKSGITGVHWYSNYNKWRARIQANHKIIHLGYFDNFDEAVKARKDAEEKYYGEFSVDNSKI